MVTSAGKPVSGDKRGKSLCVWQALEKLSFAATGLDWTGRLWQQLLGNFLVLFSELTTSNFVLAVLPLLF